MFTRDLTIWILAIAICCAIIYNLAAGMWWHPGGTISETVQAVSQRYPLLPFMLGLLIGHLLWPMYPYNVTPVRPDVVTPAERHPAPPPPLVDPKEFKNHIGDM